MQIAILGAGRIGQTLAALWAAAGHELMVASARHASAQALAKQLARTRAVAVEEAVTRAQAVLVAVPFAAWPALAARWRDAPPGLPLLDATNAFVERDGALAHEVRSHAGGSSGYVAQFVPAVRMVKVFNTVHFVALRAQAHRVEPRLAIPMAGNDAGAIAVAETLVRDAGFAPVLVGGLAAAPVLEPQGPLFGAELTAQELLRRLQAHG